MRAITRAAGELSARRLIRIMPRGVAGWNSRSGWPNWNFEQASDWSSCRVSAKSLGAKSKVQLGRPKAKCEACARHWLSCGGRRSRPQHNGHANTNAKRERELVEPKKAKAEREQMEPKQAQTRPTPTHQSTRVTKLNPQTSVTKLTQVGLHRFDIN